MHIVGEDCKDVYSQRFYREGLQMAKKCDADPDKSNIPLERLQDKSTYLFVCYGACVLQISAMEAEKVE